MELENSESVHLCAQNLHQNLCGILTSVDVENQGLSDIKHKVHGENKSIDTQAGVQMYGRIKSKYSVLKSFKLGDQVCELSKIRELSAEERSNLLIEVLVSDIKDIHCVPKPYQGLLLVMEYWVKNVQVSEVFIKAILICSFLLKIVDPIVDYNRNLEKLYSSMKSKDAKTENFYKIALKLYKNFHIEETMKTNTKKYDKNTVHKLSQFQAVFHITNSLHKVLKTDFHFPAISKLLNCTFICNFIWNFDKMTKNMNLDSLMETEVFKQYQEIESICLRLLGNFLDKTQTIVKKKKNKKDTKDGVCRIDDDTVNKDTNDCDEFFDINNKFSVLKLS